MLNENDNGGEARWFGPTSDVSREGPLPGDEHQEAQAEIMRLSSLIAAAQARILQLMVECGDRLAGGDDVSNWLAWAAGMKPSTAKAHLRVADRLESLPQIRESFRAGELSFDKTDQIARIATPETEASLLMWAKHGTASQLAQIGSGFRKATASHDGTDAAHLRRHLSYYFSEDGTFRMRAQMAADQGAIVASALEAATEHLREQQRAFRNEQLSQEQERHQTHNEADSFGALKADALVALSETYLANGMTSRPGADRHEVIVHVDPAALQGDRSAMAELDSGVGISPETALRIFCDCSFRTFSEQGAELKLGRKQRTVSPALRRAIEARDRHCTFPGCSSRAFTECHHIVWWTATGPTDEDNLTLLCLRHHRLVHEGGYQLHRDPAGELHFVRPDGTEVERVPTCRSVSEVELAEYQMRKSVDPDTWSHHIDPCDLADAVSYLCDAIPAEERDPARAGPEGAGPGPTGSGPD
ncbi:MAG: DUF222 domain-containing protein [Actinomycetota bacterium]